MSKELRIKLVLAASGFACFLTVTMFLGPSGMTDPIFQKIVVRNGDPYSGAWEQDFEVRTTIPRFCVQTRMRGHSVRLRFDLEAKNGEQLLHDFPIEQGSASFSCGRNVYGAYTLRVREESVTGQYSIEMGRTVGITRWQKSLVLFISFFVVSGILTFWQRHRNQVGWPAAVLAASRYAFQAVGLCLFVMFFYLLLHEGGHALASIAFGNFDLHGSDFFGLFGNPHSGINPAVGLAPWQSAIQSISGPLLPILIGYALFGFWRSRRGAAYRDRNIFVAVFWSFTIFALLVSGLGLLMTMAGGRADSDYSGFANSGFLPRWQSNILLLVVVLINVYQLCRVVPVLVALRRRLAMEFAASDSRDVPEWAEPNNNAR